MAEDKAVATKVTIFGETYNIRSQADPEYTNRVAEHVDRAMHLVKKQIGLQDPLKIAILASMSITDDLFQERENAEAGLAGFEKRCDALVEKIEAYLENQEAEEAVSK